MKTWDDFKPPRPPEKTWDPGETFLDEWLAGESDTLEKPEEKPQRAKNRYGRK